MKHKAPIQCVICPTCRLQVEVERTAVTAARYSIDDWAALCRERSVDTPLLCPWFRAELGEADPMCNPGEPDSE